MPAKLLKLLCTVLLPVAISVPAQAEVEITIAATGHATVPVEGSFGEARFVFDTGAEGTAVYEDFAQAAALEVTGAESLQGQTGVLDLDLVEIERLVVDGVAAGPIQAVRLPRRRDGVALAGIVGLDVFGGQVVDFNLPAMRVALLAAGSRPLDAQCAPVPATPTIGNLLTVPVVVNGVEAVGVIDTGARKTRINWALGRLLGIKPDDLAQGDTIQGATLSAVETGATSVQAVRLGSRILPTAPVLVADLPVFEAFGVADRPAIIIGLDWLTETRMVIDFPARLVWFEMAVPDGGQSCGAPLTQS